MEMEQKVLRQKGKETRYSNSLQIDGYREYVPVSLNIF